MNYEKYKNLANTKIKKYGSEIIVKSSEKKVYDKETNTYIDSGSEFSGYAIQKNFAQQNIDGTNIRFGDVLFMASLNGKPKSNDSVIFQGKTYTVINVEILNPNGSADIFYNIQAR